MLVVTNSCLIGLKFHKTVGKLHPGTSDIMNLWKQSTNCQNSNNVIPNYNLNLTLIPLYKCS